VKGSDTTIEGAGYRGVPNPEIRCSDLHLATAEDISLGLSTCDYQMLVYAALARCRIVAFLRPFDRPLPSPLTAYHVVLPSLPVTHSLHVAKVSLFLYLLPLPFALSLSLSQEYDPYTGSPFQVATPYPALFIAVTTSESLLKSPSWWTPKSWHSPLTMPHSSFVKRRTDHRTFIRTRH